MPTREYDTKKAEKLLDQADWKLSKDNNVRQKDGKALTLSMYYDKGSSEQKSRQNFYKLNLKVRHQVKH